VEIGADALTMGRKMLDHAVDIWSRCMRQSLPRLPARHHDAEFPGWAEQQWLDREIKDAARERLPQPDDLIMAG
jgi:hypothetical protein